VLKWSDGTRLEEVAAMIMMRRAGFPVPMVISYGDHPDWPNAPVSILMTRLPGKELAEMYEQFNDEEHESVFTELRTMLGVMRNWPHPWGGDRICSVLGTAIRSVRVPSHSIGPYESQAEFNDRLISPARRGDKSQEWFEEKLEFAKRIRSVHYEVVFTHGDLKDHNILVHDGHISGFIDWESAGWYPDYWEFTTAMRFCPEYWSEFVKRLGGSRYLEEREYERALNSLTVDSYAW
jgi:aminoglycoside phosphotransferase